MKKLPKIKINKLSKNFNILLLASLIVFILFSITLNPNLLVKHEWELKSQNNNVYELYLKGSLLDRTTVADVRLLTEEGSQISLIESGGFFINPMINQLGTDKNAFLVIKNPGSDSSIDKTKPLLVITLSDQSVLEIVPISQIYISKKGVFNPKIE